ncbi:hypothetical protein [Bacillus amyloliquefaciens]|uniref:hypothetical protein n=1 Tax=Bacillus amyloliquefaciens TaxID=1390 RepID=UPI001CD2ABF0|nr:hypothetical protein [Bacillus amyloliquefaciens]
MAETKNYARIKKATREAAWYADKIGKVFEVELVGPTYLIRTGPKHLSAVRKEDAELIVTENRRPKIGERVLITYGMTSSGDYKTGDICTVRSVVDIYGTITVKEHGNYVIAREYEVIVNNEVENEEADGMESVNQTVINNANTLFEKKDDKYFGYKSRFGDIVIGGSYSYRFVVHYAKTNQDVVIIPDDVNKVTTPVCTTVEESLWKSGAQAKACRDEIVEQAKADILKYRTFYGELRYFYRSIVCNVEFVINKKKSTVVALLKSVGRGTVKSKGIAKAAPSDCFNVHIGKAIALRRALCLAVPDEYLNAPQPTEVRVGDVVYYSRMHPRLTVSEGIGKGEGFVSVQLVSEYLGDGVTRIIDDSREEVGGE